MSKCTCPTRYAEDGVTIEKVATDRMCPSHGEPRGMVLTKEQMIVDSLRRDIAVTSNPSRPLTAKEKRFIAEAQACSMVVFYSRAGKPYAFGAPKNRGAFKEFEPVVLEHRWIFEESEKKSSIYYLRGK